MTTPVCNANQTQNINTLYQVYDSDEFRWGYTGEGVKHLLPNCTDLPTGSTLECTNVGNTFDILRSGDINLGIAVKSANYSSADEYTTCNDYIGENPRFDPCRIVADELGKPSNYWTCVGTCKGDNGCNNQGIESTTGGLGARHYTICKRTSWPNNNQLPCCVGNLSTTSSCNPDWCPGSQTCNNVITQQCTGNGDALVTNQNCIDWCTDNPNQCMNYLQAACNDWYNNNSSTLNYDAQDNIPTLCQCMMPTTYYDQVITNVVNNSGLSTEAEDLLESAWLQQSSQPWCFDTKCAQYTTFPPAGDRGSCPDIQTCFNTLDITVSGKVGGDVTTSQVNDCVQEDPTGGPPVSNDNNAPTGTTPATGGTSINWLLILGIGGAILGFILLMLIFFLLFRRDDDYDYGYPQQQYYQ